MQALLEQGHLRAMDYMGIQFKHKVIGAEQGKTMLQLEMDKCTTCWADRQEYMEMGWHYVSPQAALCT